MEKNRSEVLFKEPMAENFQKPMEEINPHIPEALQTQSKINTKKIIPKHILIGQTKKNQSNYAVYLKLTQMYKIILTVKFNWKEKNQGQGVWEQYKK